MQIVQLRKKGGIDSIRVSSKDRGTVTPKVYNQDQKNVNDNGTFEEDYRGKPFPATKHFLAPTWNDLKKQWSWGADVTKLTELITKMRLRYPANHKMAGEIIEPGKDVLSRLTHRQDEVFNHKDLYGKYFMENGRASLNPEDPHQEFLLYCYKGDHTVDDRNSDERINKFLYAGTRYELVSPKKETEKRKYILDKEGKAHTLLTKIQNNVEKMKAIAELMDLPGYNAAATDGDGVYLLLGEMAVKNTATSAKYGGKSYQDRFIELASMEDEDLNFAHKIIKAKQLGHLRAYVQKGYYLFNGDQLNGITNDVQAIAFFRDPKNQDKLLELIDLIQNGKQSKTPV